MHKNSAKIELRMLKRAQIERKIGFYPRSRTKKSRPRVHAAGS